MSVLRVQRFEEPEPDIFAVAAVPNSRISSLERSSTTSGSASRTSTIEVAAPAEADGAPRPDTRNRWPACVPGGMRSLHRPVERRHFDARAERRLVDRHRHDHVQVVPVAPEHRMRLDLDVDVQVAVRAAVPSGVAALRDPQPRAIAHARRESSRRSPSLRSTPVP